MREPHSDRHQTLTIIHDTLGSTQVITSQFDLASSRVADKAFRKEHDNNWTSAYRTVSECDVPRDSNVKTSHVVYKLRAGEDGTRKLKARLVPPWKQEPWEREHPERFVKCASRYRKATVITANILERQALHSRYIRAYLQSGPIQRKVFVRPPRGWKGKSFTLWKLLKLPYGIVEAGRQWQKTVENWMLSKGNLQRFYGLSQLFVKRNESANIILMIPKVTDDLLLTDTESNMQLFIADLRQIWTVAKVMIDERFFFNGCEIVQDREGSLDMSMERYLERINFITLARARRKQFEEMGTEAEEKTYQSLACTLLYIGSGVLPQPTFVTSSLQQQIAILKVGYLVLANGRARELLKLKPRIRFHKATNIKMVQVCGLSDASSNQKHMNDYVQYGIITGIRIKTGKVMAFVHTLDLTSQKQRRMYHSSYGA